MTNLIAGIFDIVIGCAMILFYLRFMLQFAGVEAQEPYVKPIFRLTRIVDVFGRVFPTLGDGKINTAALVLLFLLRLVFIWGVLTMLRLDSQNIGLFSMTDFNMSMIDYLNRHFSPVMLFFVASVTLIVDFLRMAQYLLIASFVISWIVIFTQKLHPGLALLSHLSDPIIAPFRKVLPATGMLDLAPMISFFLIILLETVVQTLGGYLLTLA